MPTSPLFSDDQVSSVRERVQAFMPASITQLRSLVKIPSIAFEGYDPETVHRSAERVQELLLDAGMPEVEILSVADGAPAVVGRMPAAAGQPTVLLYAHHDVQPVGDIEAWSSDPFELTERDGRAYGRGSADDKAGVMAHVTALRVAREALAEQGVGVVVFIEGEEEAGSPTFRAFIEEHRDKLAADLIIVADSANWKVGIPALTSSLRGVVSVLVQVDVLTHAVHSGMFGGPVLDAPTQLARLLATLHTDDGDVAVPGLVNAQRPEVEMTEADFRQDAGVIEGLELSGSGSLTERIWAKPAISVIGIDAPSVRDASNTLVPTARARVSMRIAPGQDPAAAMDALVQHLYDHAPTTAKVTVERGEEGKPYQAPAGTAGAELARAALKSAWDTDPVDTGIGGSIPFIADLLEVFPNADVLVTGVEDPDTRAHGVDESLHLGEFERVCVAESLILLGAGGALAASNPSNDPDLAAAGTDSDESK